MLIDKGEYLLDETKLTEEEAIAFIACMEEELDRHREAIIDSHRKVLYTDSETVKTFYYFSIERHKIDIKAINNTLSYLKEKWNL